MTPNPGVDYPNTVCMSPDSTVSSPSLSLIHIFSEGADWYERLGFRTFRDDPLRLYLLF